MCTFAWSTANCSTSEVISHTARSRFLSLVAASGLQPAARRGHPGEHTMEKWCSPLSSCRLSHSDRAIDSALTVLYTHLTLPTQFRL